MSFHANHTGNVNKDPDNDVQFYLGICVVLSGLCCMYHTCGTFLLILLLNMLLLLNFSAFHTGFQSGHCHILWTGQYQVIVPTRSSTHK